MIWLILDRILGGLWMLVNDGHGNPLWLDKMQAYVFMKLWQTKRRRRG